MSLSDYKLAYEYAPITLIGGIAQNVVGGMLPILYLMQPNLYPSGPGSPTSNVDPTGVTSPAPNLDASKIFARFTVPPGGGLIRNDVAEFPVANNVVAANAQIVQPLEFSLLMICPSTGANPLPARLGIITNLQSMLSQHTLSGGTYNVATPSFIYLNSLLMDLVDVTPAGEDESQVQTIWEWRFRRPLLTVAEATAAQNALMSRLSQQSQVNTDGTGALAWTSPDNAVGSSQSLAASQSVPSAATQTSAASAAAGYE